MGGQGGKRAWALPPEHQFRAGRGPGVRGDPRPGLSRQRARSPLTLRMETPDQARAGRPLAVGPRGGPGRAAAAPDSPHPVRVCPSGPGSGPSAEQDTQSRRVMSTLWALLFLGQLGTRGGGSSRDGEVTPPGSWGASGPGGSSGLGPGGETERPRGQPLPGTLFQG